MEDVFFFETINGRLLTAAVSTNGPGFHFFLDSFGCFFFDIQLNSHFLWALIFGLKKRPEHIKKNAKNIQSQVSMQESRTLDDIKGVGKFDDTEMFGAVFFFKFPTVSL